MSIRTRKLLEGILFLLFGLGLVLYSIYDSLDGSFYAASKYGLGNTLSIIDGETGYWLAVGFRVFLGFIGIILGILTLNNFLKTKKPYD